MKRQIAFFLIVAVTTVMILSTAQAGTLKAFYDFKNGSLKATHGKSVDLIIPEKYLSNLCDNGYYFSQTTPPDLPAYPGPALSTAVTGTDNYAIEIRFKLSDSSLTWWHKILDFWNLTPNDVGLYVLDGKITFYQPEWYPWGTSGEDIIPTETFVNLLVTRDSNSNLFRAYLDGKLQFEFLDDDGWAIFDRGLVWFFTDDYATEGGEATTGFVDWIKIYDQKK
jgi:hypothetical protein